jgi:D-arabinose 1-dehydrogenase-like Zn-dependent alcohol dehydrogenase
MQLCDASRFVVDQLYWFVVVFLFVLFGSCCQLFGLVFRNNSDDRTRVNGTLHLIIDTISANHDIVRLMKMLTTDGICCLVGLPPDPIQVGAFNVVGGRKTLTGSGIGR